MISNYLGFNLISVNWDSLRKKVKFSFSKIKGYKRNKTVLSYFIFRAIFQNYSLFILIP